MGEFRRSGPGVLVVDDDTCVRAALTELLDQAGFDVKSASNGASALRLASLERPRVVLLDLALPELTGVEVLRELRNHSETRDAAVIVMTGNSDRIADARRAGADLVLEKPFDVDELLSAVQNAIHHRLGPSRRVEAPAVATVVASWGHPTRPHADDPAAAWRARHRPG